LIKDNLLRRQLNDIEKTKAGLELEKIEKKRASERMLGGKKIDPSQNFDKGRVTNIIAKQVGFGSGFQYEKAREVVESGNKELIENIKNKKISIHQAYTRLKREHRRQEIQNSIIKNTEYDIRCGDALELLDDLESESYDLIFVDPPYGVRRDDIEWDCFPSEADFWSFTEAWLEKLIPKLRSTGRLFICFAQERMFELYELIKKYITNDYLRFGNLLIWNYKNNIKYNDSKRFHRTYDPIFYYYGLDAEGLNMERGETWGENYNNLDCWTIAIPQSNFNDEKLHPAQKPIELLRNIIRVGSKTGDRILDPFAGSGTTGVVCRELGRNFTLIEKNPEYIKLIYQRLEMTKFIEK